MGRIFKALREMMGTIIALVACILMVSFAAPVAMAQRTDPSQTQAAIDQAFEQTFTRYHLPGLAVAIVDDGEVVYRRVAGERHSGSGQPIDSQTLFKIASNTKAMTGALLARLVDQGKLQWDDPVIRYFPDFAMYDPWVTREIQVRDLLIHNSGLGAGAGDLMLWPEPNAFTRKQVIHALRYLKPQYSFRSRYAYDNNLYIVAGEVAAAAGGAPYDELMRKEIFQPLGMTRCQVGAWQRDQVGNVAQPHIRSGGRNIVVRADPEIIPDLPMMAAGGVRCSLDDMLKWVAAWLQPAESVLVDGKPWLSAAQRRLVWTPHTLMPLSQRMREWDNSHYSAYGYGWRLTDVDGTAKVSHTGTLSGMYSSVTLLPELGVGIVVLINADAEDARTALTQTLVKQFTAPQKRLTFQHYADLLDDARAARQERLAREPSTNGEPVSASANLPWTGRYRDPWLGEASICPGRQHIEFSVVNSPKLAGQVRRIDQRLYVAWHDPTVEPSAWLFFSDSAPPSPTVLTMAKTDPEGDFSSDFEDLRFVRIGDCPRAP